MASDEKRQEETAAIAHEAAERRKRIQQEKKARRKEVERLELGNKQAKVEEEEEEEEDEVIFVEIRKGKAPGTYDNTIRVKQEADTDAATKFSRACHGEAGELDEDLRSEADRSWSDAEDAGGAGVSVR